MVPSAFGINDDGLKTIKTNYEKNKRELFFSSSFCHEDEDNDDNILLI